MIITDEMVAHFKDGFHGSTLNDDQVRRGLAAVFLFRGLFDGTAPMADGGEIPMTAAEEVLAWLLIEKIGVPDDVSYSPDQAQKIIAERLAHSPSPQPKGIGKAGQIADAIEACDWSGCSIGNKEILKSAVAVLRSLT